MKSGIAESNLYWLPLVSTHSAEWVVIFDIANMKNIGYLPLDGFY